MKVINSHRQAIKTKYLGPTTHKGARVKATCYAGTITISWDYSLNSDGNHDKAALELCKKLEWDCDLLGGSSPDQTGNLYVMISDNN